MTQHNAGITAARNAALKLAQGIWVCFVDNDDIVASNAVQIYCENVENDIDILYSDYARFTTDIPHQSGNVVRTSKYFSGSDITKLQNDCINRLRSNRPLISHKTLPTPWAKLYRREFLCSQHIYFNQKVTHEEDIIFNFEVLSLCHKVKVIDYISYYYRWSVNSESHRFRPNLPHEVEYTLAAYRDIISRRNQGRADIALLFRYRVLWELIYCVVLGPVHPQNPASYLERKRQFFTILNEDIFSDIFSVVQTTKFEWKQSVVASLIKLKWFWMINSLGHFIGQAR